MSDFNTAARPRAETASRLWWRTIPPDNAVLSATIELLRAISVLLRREAATSGTSPARTAAVPSGKSKIAKTRGSTAGRRKNVSGCDPISSEPAKMAKPVPSKADAVSCGGTNFGFATARATDNAKVGIAGRTETRRYVVNGEKKT